MIRPSLTVERLVQLKRILVTGASGLLGSKLVDMLSKEYEVVPTHNMQALHPNSMRMNMVERDEVFRVLCAVCPDMVVHTAAETNVDKCETEREWAWRLNAAGTRNIAEACAKIGAKLIYVSTDYVFDGEKGLYSEEDEANPVNYYGLTKLRGEQFAREFCEGFVIARTSVLYGWHRKKLNFATWVVDSLRIGKRISVVEDHYNSPTLADNLAEMILSVVKIDATGIYHMAGGERVSRYMFALKIAEAFDLDRTLITPVKMKDVKVWIARRPMDSSLCVDKVRKEIKVSPLDLTEALERIRSGPGAK
jgi:dTDP-4-dehydrorhamnose reductase